MFRMYRITKIYFRLQYIKVLKISKQEMIKKCLFFFYEIQIGRYIYRLFHFQIYYEYCYMKYNHENHDCELIITYQTEYLVMQKYF